MWILLFIYIYIYIFYILRTVPGSSSDLSGVKVMTRYEKEEYDEKSESSGTDSPRVSYTTDDLLSLRVSTSAYVCVFILVIYTFHTDRLFQTRSFCLKCLVF